MKRCLVAVLAMAGLSPLCAQTHAVKKPETVVRAIAVYEWTGDEAKPTASRLVPVSIFINSQIEDAGVYMARPVPFALDRGTIFEVEQSGKSQGTVELSYQRHLEGAGGAVFDDGWMGYGLFKPTKMEQPVLSARKNAPLPQVVTSGGNRPHFGNSGSNSSTTTASADDSGRPALTRRTGSDGDSGTASDASTPAAKSSTGTSTPAASTPTASTPTASTTASSTTTKDDDSNRPALTRRTGSEGDSGTASAASTPAATSSAGTSTPAASKPAASTTASSTTVKDDDPDRPVLVRRDGSDADSTPAATPAGSTSGASTGSGSGTSGSGSSTATTDDSNRPTLSRRTSDTNSTSSTSNSDDDVDRPTLKKRTPEQTKNNKRPGDTASVQSASNLNDDPDRPTLHRGTAIGPEIPPLNGLPKDMRQMVAVSDAKDRPEHDFTRPWDSPEEQAQVLTRMQEVARARLAKYDVPAPAAAPAPTAAPAATTTKTTSARAKKAAAAAPPPPPPPPPPVELDEESLRGYTLSYGGAATFVYSASSPGAGGATRYVTVVAQKETLGDMKTALTSVTDTNHLDRTPWMRLVDVVDAEASNRASLLFEMRAQNVRQFALYRVIGAQAEQVFQTGTTE